MQNQKMPMWGTTSIGSNVRMFNCLKQVEDIDTNRKSKQTIIVTLSSGVINDLEDTVHNVCVWRKYWFMPPWLTHTLFTLTWGRVCFEYVPKCKMPVFPAFSITLVSKCTLSKLRIFPFTQFTFPYHPSHFQTREIMKEGWRQRTAQSLSLCGKDESVGAIGWNSVINIQHAVACHPSILFLLFVVAIQKNCKSCSCISAGMLWSAIKWNEFNQKNKMWVLWYWIEYCLSKSLCLFLNSIERFCLGLV